MNIEKVALVALLLISTTTLLAKAYQCQTEGFHVNPVDCNRFIRCVDQAQNGRLHAFHFQCPGGKLLILVQYSFFLVLFSCFSIKN